MLAPPSVRSSAGRWRPSPIRVAPKRLPITAPASIGARAPPPPRAMLVALATHSRPSGEYGTYAASVAITDTADNQTVSATSTVPVTDPAAISGTPIVLAIAAGAAFINQAVAAFTDPGGAE